MEPRGQSTQISEINSQDQIVKSGALDSISFKTDTRKNLIEIKIPYRCNRILKWRCESRFH